MRLCLILLLALAASPAMGQDITSNLQAHYKFQGNGDDETVNNRDLSGGASSYATGVVGNCAVSPSFDSTAHTYMNSAATYSVACWVRIDDEHDVQPVEFVPSIAAVGELGLRVERATPSTKGKSDSALTADYRSGSVGTASAGAIIGSIPNPDYSDETADSWQFVCLRVSSGAATLYSGVDGGSLTSASLSGNWTLPANVAKLRVGSVVSSRYSIDELRIYTRALAPADVAAPFAE